eukprot:4995771-Amphidinium_carterae.1
MNPMSSYGLQRTERQPHLFGAHSLQYRQGTAVATTKSPPVWDPNMAADQVYSDTLSEWWKDVIRWQAATEVSTERQGPLLALAVGGAARTIADETPIEALQHGGQIDLDGQGVRPRSGSEILFAALLKKFLLTLNRKRFGQGWSLCPSVQEGVKDWIRLYATSV